MQVKVDLLWNAQELCEKMKQPLDDNEEAEIEEGITQVKIQVALADNAITVECRAAFLQGMLILRHGVVSEYCECLFRRTHLIVNLF